ncbi:MAG TPA: oxygen-insensitive NADPH nitroreductase [Bacillota bacterium]|nr:oxygen-insensitive NADPH nitroreductase [Bacillota bacterium]
MENDVLQLLKHHTSIRQYKSTPIPDTELRDMIHAAQHAASSNFAQAYSIVHINEPEKIEKLTTFASNKQQITSAPVVLLFCADFKRLEHACLKHGVTLKEHNLENFIVTTVDTALFAQNFVIAAESRGYGICYIGGVRNNPDKISELVDLPDHVFPLFGMTVGVPAEQQEVKPRLPVEAILHENNYDENKYDHILDTYDETMATYYQERSANKKTTNWTKTMAEFLKNHRREHMREFVKNRKFNL